MTHSLTNVSSKEAFCGNSEADASELLHNLEETFILYYVYSVDIDRSKCSITHRCVTRWEKVKAYFLCLRFNYVDVESLVRM